MKSAVKYVVFLSLFVYGLSVPQQAESQTNVSNTWSSAGQMTVGRSGSAAVRLPDGSIVITGGTDSSGAPLASAEVFKPTTGTFTTLPSMNVPRANHAAILLKSGDVLVTGGLTTGGGYSDTAEIYSVSNKKWTLLQASIGTGLEGQSMVLLSDGNVLIAGGASTTKVVSALILYNATTKTFTPIGTLLTARTNAAAAATQDGRVLIVGGADIDGKVLASTEIFTYAAATMTGTITAGPSMSSAREFATATGTYDGVAVIGGNDGEKDLGTAEIFSQWTNAFRVITGGTPRSHHFAMLLPNNGSILAIGGTGGTAVDLLQPWANAKAGAFIAAPASLYNQDQGSAASIGLGILLAAGGTGSNASNSEAYLFPTVRTENLEYMPGTPVQMSGTGFKPNETIDLHIHLWVDQTTQDTPDATVKADASGNFSYNGYAPNDGDLGARYHLTAVGETSGYQAQTIFGDGTNTIGFTNTALNQPAAPGAGSCGELTIANAGTAPLSPLYLYDSTATGTFYSNSTCTTQIPSSVYYGQVVTTTPIAGALSTNVWYENTAPGTPDILACSEYDTGFSFIITITPEAECETGSAVFQSQTETIYGAAYQLAWASLPGNGAPGVALAQQPAVEVLDQGGNLVSVSTVPITLTLVTNPGPGGTVLTCTPGSGNPLNATAGVAQFSGCSINNTATSQYCLQATSSPLQPTAVTPTNPACFSIVNPTSATASTVVASTSPATSPVTVVDNGTAYATITVTLTDAGGDPESGKTVVLTQTGGSSTIAAGSNGGVSNGSGVVTFRVSDGSPETVTYTAVDITDGITLTHTAAVIFGPGQVSSSASTVSASPISVTANGTSYSTITVTLNDSSGDPVSGATVTLAATACTTACTPTVGSSVITTVSGTTNANGVATFTVADAAVQNVTYTASYSSTANGTGTLSTRTVQVSFITSGTNVTLVWTTAPPANAAYNSTFTVAAGLSPSVSADRGAITYSTTGVCTNNGARVTMTSGTGTCTVTATIAAYKTSGGSPVYYNSAVVVSTPPETTATLAPQAALTITGAPASAAINTSFIVGTSGGSGTGAVTFTSTTTGVCTVSNGDQINMVAGTGNCIINASQAGDTNYAATALPLPTATIQATLKTAAVKVVCSVPGVYDGLPQGADTLCSVTTNPATNTTTSVALATEVTYTYNGSSTAPTNAGSYTVVGTISGDAQYSGTSQPVTMTINPEPVVATASNFTSVYTGAAIPVTTNCFLAGQANYTAGLICTNSPATVGPDVQSGALAASVAATPTDTLSNYTISYVGGSYSITAATPVITESCTPGAFTYTGSAITPCTYTLTVPGPAETAVESYANNVAVGTNTASYSVSAPGYTNTTVSPAAVDVIPLNAPTVFFSITSASGIISLNDLTQPFTGKPVPVSVTVTPNTLAYTVTYTGSGSTVYGPSPTAPTAVGTYSVTGTITSAGYSGSDTETETITQATPPMNLVLDPGSSSPAPTGSPVYFALTVDSSLPCPTQTVQWNVNSTAAGSPVTLPATCDGPVIYENSALTGSSTVDAVYSGDTNYAGAQSNNVVQVVQADTTSVTLAASATILSTGQTGTFTATITPAAGVTPAGTVNFLDGTSVIGTQNLSGTAPYTAVFTDSSLGTGPHTISAAYVPSGTDPTGTSSAITVNETAATPIAPIITWATPAPVPYPTALSATQLNATASVGGTWVYSMPVGYTPLAGPVNLWVTFTPTDTSLPTQTASVTLIVTSGMPTITWPTASAITYGQTLDDSTLSGDSSSITGSFAWTTPTTSPNAGVNQPESVTFTPDDTLDYSPTTHNVDITVNQDTPTLVCPTANPISVGAELSTSTLSGGSATNAFNSAVVTGNTADGADGGFYWTAPTTALANAGTYSENITFTPVDTTDYITETITCNNIVTVNTKGNPTVTVWPTASGITYGAALSTSILTPSAVTGTPNANASIPGSFAWTAGNFNPGAGNDSESVTFTPSDTTDFNTVSQNITVVVAKATPTISTPPTASAITVGQSLVSSILTPSSVTGTPNANASVPGGFAWANAATIPAAGPQSESVIFTPSDGVDYNSVTFPITVAVNTVQAAVVYDYPTPSPITYGQTLASSNLTPVSSTVSTSTTTPGSTSVLGTFAWTVSGTAPQGGSQQESVTFTPNDTTDYSATSGMVTIMVNPATSTLVTPPTAGPVSTGQPLSASSLTGGNVTANGVTINGIWSWGNSATIPVNGNLYSATFTPSIPADYTTLTGIMVPITVNSLMTPTVTTWPTASPIFYGQPLSASSLTGGVASVGGNFVWTSPLTVPPVGTAQSEDVTFEPNDSTDYNTVPGTAKITVYAAVQSGGYIVTVSTDDTGSAANCTPQSNPGTGTDRSCSLRDALLAAASGGGGVTFDSTIFAAPTMITLSNGPLAVPTSAALAGPTTGTGAALTNLVTVDGGSASTVFTVASGVTGASIANLTIQNGKGAAGAIQNAGTLTLSADTITNNAATGAGGGINNSGTLTVTASSVSTNTAAGNGGGINNTGTLTLTDSTIAGNTSSALGGGIYNNATLTAADSTISGNSAATPSGGGGIDNVSPGTVALANSILSGNTVSGNADDFNGTAYTDNNGNVAGVVNGTPVNATAISLSPVGSYGGPTLTAVPLPGSPAICAGVAASIPSGLITDERGLPNTNTSYTGSACVDSGAVQTNYAMSFTTEPTGAPVEGIIPAAVTLTESGSPFQPPVTIPLTLNGTGILTGGSTATASGVATYSLQVDTAGSGDTLTANLTLNGGLAPAVALTATSTSFTITPTVTETVTLDGLSQTYTGSPLPATATASPAVPSLTFTFTFTYTGTGTTTYPLSATAPTAAGTYTVVGTISNPGYQGTATGTMTIAQAPTTTTLTSNAITGTNPPGQSITLTAVVAPTAVGTTGPPTGTVSFYSGSTLLNTTPAPLTAGTATYAATNLPVGATDQITAVYSGDNNFLTSTTSTSIPIVVGGLSFTITANAPTNQVVAAGSMASYQFAVAPADGNYPDTVTFAATGAPATATVTFNPTTIAANGGAQTVTMQVQTSTTSAKKVAPSIGSRLAPLTIALFFLPLFGARRLRRQGRRLSRQVMLLLILGCSLVVGAMVTGCGGSSIIGSADQSYTITVTATSGSVQQTAQVTLVVQ